MEMVATVASVLVPLTPVPICKAVVDIKVAAPPLVADRIFTDIVDDAAPVAQPETE